jgi:hypothetical protein
MEEKLVCSVCGESLTEDTAFYLRMSIIVQIVLRKVWN